MSKPLVFLTKASVVLPLPVTLLCPAASAQDPPKVSKERQKFAYIDFNSAESLSSSTIAKFGLAVGVEF